MSLRTVFALIATLYVVFFVNLLAHAEGPRVTKAAVVVSKILQNREPMTPLRSQTDYTAQVAFEIDMKFLEIGYWENRIHTEAVESTVKTVGWEFEKGVHLGQIDIFWQHHSRHTMDSEQPLVYDAKNDKIVQTKFPVYDRIGLRLNLLTD